MHTPDQLNAMTDVEYKVLENRLRRMAARRGFAVMKSRTRDPRAVDYCGYMIADANTNVVVAGGEGRGWLLGLDDVERFLEEGQQRRRRAA